MNIKSFTLALTALAATSTSFAQDLKIQNFLAKPEHFGVTSTLIEGDKEVLLVNAQFSKSEALRIVADILDSGKTLKTIFVSYGDPDFYFGLDVFKQYFPNVKTYSRYSGFKSCLLGTQNGSQCTESNYCSASVYG